MIRYVDMSVMLGRSWSVAQFVYSSTASRYKIDNRLPEIMLGNARKCARLIEQCEEVLGHPFVLLSGYRVPELARRLGASQTSYHCVALAADGYFRGMEMLVACRALAASPLPIIEIEAKQTQLHIAYGAAADRRLFQQYVEHGPVLQVTQFGDQPPVRAA